LGDAAASIIDGTDDHCYWQLAAFTDDEYGVAVDDYFRICGISM
jgi:hypothetical protein